MEYQNYLKIALAFFCVFDCVYSAGIIVPCKNGDLECYTRSANLALPKILAGIPELGVESSDPLHMDFITSTDNRLEYNYTDVTLNGVKNCEIKDVKFSLESNSLSFGAYCKVDMHGDYVMSGNLLVLRVEGDGKFHIDAEKIFIDITTELKTVKGDDGKDHINIKNFHIKVDALEKVTFDYTNIFNGKNKELADGVLKFANDSYKEVFHETATPIFYPIIKRIMKNVNKFLKTVPKDELFV